MREESRLRYGKEDREGTNRREQRESIEGLNSASLPVSRGRGGEKERQRETGKGREKQRLMKAMGRGKTTLELPITETHILTTK